MGKKVRLMAGAAGMAPALGLAIAAPAAASAGHVPGKKVSLAAGRAAGATACTGTFSKSAKAGSPRMGLSVSVSYKGSCVLGATGHLYLSESSSYLSNDLMRTRVYDHRARVFSGQARFFYSDGAIRASQNIGVIGHKVCAVAFSPQHPAKKIAGPVCVKI